MASGIYIASRQEVRGTFSYPHTPNPVTVENATGLSAASPNNMKDFFNVVSISETMATISTYTYQLYNIMGQSLGWYPCTPADVRFNISALSAYDTDLYLPSETVAGSRSHTAISRIETGSDYNIQVRSK